MSLAVRPPTQRKLPLPQRFLHIGDGAGEVGTFQRVDMIGDGGTAAARGAAQVIEKVAEGLRPPEAMEKAAAPAVRHVDRRQEGVEKAKVAGADAILLQADRLEGADGEAQGFRLRSDGIVGIEPFDAGLVELRHATRLVAEGGPGVAVAGLARDIRGMGEMVAAGRHGQVGTQAQLAAGGIGEDVGAGADALAGAVEEHVGGLDDVGRDEVESGAGEHRHDALRLRVERLAFGRSPAGHGR